MTELTVESPFFVSEEEALKIIDDNMEYIKSKLDASSGQAPDQSSAGDPASTYSPGNSPCAGDGPNCQCCLCG